MTICEYIWIDGTGLGIRSKAKVLYQAVEKIEDLPEWNFDGSSTYQSTTKYSEIILKPVAMYPDPFRSLPNLLVLCETYSAFEGDYSNLVPANSNFRFFAEKIMETAKEF